MHNSFPMHRDIIHNSSFLVIGSGIAGLNFALSASKFGRVLVVTKKKIADTNTNRAQGGVAAVLHYPDTIASHVQDTLEAGSYHNDKKAVKFLASHGKKAVQNLIKLGVPFENEPTREGGHSCSRVLRATDFTGQAIEKTLIECVRNNPQITVLENTFALDLITQKKICYGAQVISANNKIENIFAHATILATGGVGQIYRWTTNPAIATGDGIAMAYRAGAKLKDLEFIQFHPTVLRNNEMPLFLLSEALRGEGAYVVNEKGKRFLFNWHKSGELAPRDIVAQAIAFEERRGSVYLDFTHASKKFLRERFPGIFAGLKKRGFDLSRDRIPIAPAAHYLCGGIITDLNGQTSIKRLFALGETACTGVHGANRLASNSLLEAAVFSETAAKYLAHLKRSTSPKEIKSPTTKIVRHGELKIDNLNQKVQNLMWNKVGILRTKASLNSAKTTLQKWEKSFAFASASTTNLKFAETKNLVTCARLIAQSAEKRQKSLGVHQIVKTLPKIKPR